MVLVEARINGGCGVEDVVPEITASDVAIDVGRSGERASGWVDEIRIKEGGVIATGSAGVDVGEEGVIEVD